MCGTGRLPCAGGRSHQPQREQEICKMEVASNDIALREILSATLEDSCRFQNIKSVSLPTVQIDE